MKKLGELLTEKGLITAAQLAKALELQTRDKSLIGKIMVTENYIRLQSLQQVLAEKYNLEFVDLNKTEPDLALIKTEKRDEYFAIELLPFKQEGNVITLAVTDLNEKVKLWSARNYIGYEVKYVITSPFDILWTLQKHFAHNDDEQARFALFRKHPEFSARKLLGRRGTILMLSALFVFEAVFFLSPETSFAYFGMLMNLLCFLTISYKSAIFLVGAVLSRKRNDASLNYFPIYTILVPLYREEKSIKRLLRALEKLDYPRSRLDIKLVVENDDNITIAAIKKNAPPQYMEIIRVPFSLPRTKPKACNYALRYARGEFVTIFDAEDEPDPQQLKKALEAFTIYGREMACVQARLNYYNANKNYLTRWFALEYATWFEVVIRGLEGISSPLLLGGTSNHIRTDVLKEIGGWDAFNVTEDADLGMRLAQHGFRATTIDSITMEEAPSKLFSWIKQRTRWLKGFMQTYFVHMRNIKGLVKNTGWQGFATLQFFVGLPFLIYLLVPIWMGLAAFISAPYYLINFAFFNLFYGIIAHIAMAIAAENKLVSHSGNRVFSFFPYFAICTIPLYMFLHVVAAYRALYQLLVKPQYWDKTEHGTAE